MPLNRTHPEFSQAHCYVEFDTSEEAEQAVKHMDGGIY